jgi:fatty acid desaturase/cytochrome b involved in lipid metabolism
MMMIFNRMTPTGRKFDHLNVRANHEKLVAKKSPKFVTLKEFRDSTSKGGKQWTVINGSVYDLSSLVRAGTHPGGDFLSEFVGIDASLYFYTIHVKGANVWARLRPCWVGYLDKWAAANEEKQLAPKADLELMAMIDDLAAKGLFVYPIRDIILQVAFCLALVVGQLVLAMQAFPKVVDMQEEAITWATIDLSLLCISILLGAAAYLAGAYFLHDSGHQSMFATKKANRNFTKWAGLGLMGSTTAAETFEIHDYHHCFPNVIDRDGTLNTGPFKWHPDQLLEDSLARGYNIWAPALWHGLALWLYAPIEINMSIRVSLKKREYLLFSLFLARAFLIFAVPMFLGYSWHVGASHYFSICLAGYHMALTSTWNHMAEAKENIAQFNSQTHHNKRSFVYHQAGKTRSLNHSAFEDGLVAGYNNSNTIGAERSQVARFLHQVVSWCNGHLNYHTEHHLIPYLPRQNLPLVAAKLRRICQEDDTVPHEHSSEVFSAKTYSESFLQTFHAVGNPLKYSKFRRETNMFEIRAPLGKALESETALDTVLEYINDTDESSLSSEEY